ncbi:hypothetical protein GPECTOR_53g168 [Gonium pectorale]|uniref:Uncharacterized protein n=1 Tax=Gonium pectorale TaxID=33097 RepID=A0A150G6V5_GONPE|nr:hypothetical protein GPECTOR_53g168 [Gonium pectorale]|eukprot:KXZ45582.1 hypothetical protein GPECTOR_53g168 [Gonium pectorale]
MGVSSPAAAGGRITVTLHPDTAYVGARANVYQALGLDILIRHQHVERDRLLHSSTTQRAREAAELERAVSAAPSTRLGPGLGLGLPSRGQPHEHHQHSQPHSQPHSHAHPGDHVEEHGSRHPHHQHPAPADEPAGGGEPPRATTAATEGGGTDAGTTKAAVGEDAAGA